MAEEKGTKQTIKTLKKATKPISPSTRIVIPLIFNPIKHQSDGEIRCIRSGSLNPIENPIIPVFPHTPEISI